MIKIPFTQSVVVTGSERQDIANDFSEAAKALEESAALNFSLLQDWMAANSKMRELSNIIVTQADASSQIMQINLLISDALGRIRQRASDVEHADELADDIEAICAGLTAQLEEFGSAE